SLCPLPTELKSTTGFIPNAATANAVRSGRRRRASHQVSPSVPRLAPIATSRYTEISAPIERTWAASTPDAPVNSGPYTAGVSTHLYPTRAEVGSSAMPVGGTTGGCAWDTAAIRADGTG